MQSQSQLQSLHLLNSTEVQDKLTLATGRAAQWGADTARPVEERVRELYYWVYAREPQPDELPAALAHIAKQPDPKLAFEDLIWALANTNEFLFNHYHPVTRSA